MPIFEIQTPDGRTLDIEAPDEGTALRGAQEWYKANPDPKKVAEAEVRSGDNRPDYRPEPMLGERFQRLSDQLMDPFGVQDEIVGAGQAARRFVTSGGSFDEAGKAYSDAAERVRAERRVARGENTIIPELLGGAATVGVSAGAPVARGALETAKQAAKAGAAFGGVGGFTTGEGGLVNRLSSGATGAGAGAALGPLISNVAAPAAARLWGAGKSAVNYAGQAINAARNPETAAVNRVADAMVDAGVSPTQVRAAVSPQTSANLRTRGFTEADIADIISRQLAGEPATSVAASYAHLTAPGGGKFTAQTARSYLRQYQDHNPTPLNMVDVATEIQGDGGAQPLWRLGRAAMGIADDAETGQRLINRQTAQSGRVADIIQKSDTQGRRLEDEVLRLTGAAKKEERAAYNAARQQAQPISIEDVIRDARARAGGRQGEISEQFNKAVDLFFEPEMRQALQSPATRLAITEAEERLADAVAKGARPDALARLQRRLDTAIEQDEFSRPLRQAKVGQPVKDVGRFIDARQELDQMIERSLQDGRPTPLTQVLTQFRTELNTSARANNQALTSADARFYDNRSAERIIEDASSLAKGLNPRSREAMREFRDMTPTQQELFRVAFERNMADAALNVRNNAGAANQFGTEAFKELVNAFYPQKAGAAVWERGQALLRNLNREAITTRTTNAITGRANSPTAPWLMDMEGQMANARAAADAATGRFGKLLDNLSTRLARQIGQSAAKAQLSILTETDPAKLLPLLNRLEKAAKGSAARKRLVHDVRQLRAMNRPAVAAAVGAMAGPDRDSGQAR